MIALSSYSGKIVPLCRTCRGLLVASLPAAPIHAAFDITRHYSHLQRSNGVNPLGSHAISIMAAGGAYRHSFCNTTLEYLGRGNHDQKASDFQQQRYPCIQESNDSVTGLYVRYNLNLFDLLSESEFR